MYLHKNLYYQLKALKNCKKCFFPPPKKAKKINNKLFHNLRSKEGLILKLGQLIEYF